YTYDPNDNAGRTHPEQAAGYAEHWDTPTSVLVDPLGRTVRTTVRNGPERGDWHTTTASYDIRGNLLTQTDELGRVAFRHGYDLAGHRLRTEQLDGGVHVSVLDATGQPVEQRDSRGALGLHAHDMAHRPVRAWLADAADSPVTLRQVLVYGDAADSGLSPEQAAAANLRGVVIRHHDEAGVVVTERRDLDGNVTESVRRVVSDEQLGSVHAGAPTTGWEGTPWRMEWQPPAGVSLEAHANSLLADAEYRSSSTFDALGRPRTAVLPADVEGHRATVRPRYNSAGGLRGVELDDVAYVEQIGYDAKGQRTLVVHGNGVLTRYGYDPDTFRLRRLRTERFTATGPSSYRVAGAPLQDLEYGYDLVGNLVALTDRTPGSGIPANPHAGRVADAELARLVAAGDALVRAFDYDPRYRLVGATGREHDLDPGEPSRSPWTDIPRGSDVTRTRDYAQGYDYDPAGNLLRMTHQAGSGAPNRTYAPVDGGNRLASLTVGSDTIGYTYDVAGNVVAEGASRHFAWDGAGRLSAFRVQAGASEPSIHAQYLYDAAGQRVRKLVRRQGGQLDSTTYVGGVFEHFRQTTGSQVRENTVVHVGDGEQREALVRVGPPAPGDATPAVTYQAGDHLGSAVLVLDGAGGEVSREEFTPYGETSFGGHAFKRYRFTGKERDEESGLAYHGARYYAPWLARWTATDPAGGVDGPNLYQYVRSNPMVLTDPSGTQSAPSETKQSAGTGAAQVTQGVVAAGLDVARGVAGLVDPDTYEGIATEMGRRYDEFGGGFMGALNAVDMFNPISQAYEIGLKIGTSLGDGDLREAARQTVHGALAVVSAAMVAKAPRAATATSAAAEVGQAKGAMSIQLSPSRVYADPHKNPMLPHMQTYFNKRIERRMTELGIPAQYRGIRGNFTDDLKLSIDGRGAALETPFDHLNVRGGGENLPGRGINVGAGVLGKASAWPEFNAASLRTRIDSVIAHEWLEFNRTSSSSHRAHREAVRRGRIYDQLPPALRLPISIDAKNLLKTMPF
ncbi:MAG: RHS repeat domain-containing protein, partial [Dermatophilaceae bacterium]